MLPLQRHITFMTYEYNKDLLLSDASLQRVGSDLFNYLQRSVGDFEAEKYYDAISRKAGSSAQQEQWANEL